MPGHCEPGTHPGETASPLRPVADAEDSGAMPLRTLAPLSAPVTPMGRECGCRICWLMGACGPLPADERRKSSFDVVVTATRAKRPQAASLFGD